MLYAIIGLLLVLLATQGAVVYLLHVHDKEREAWAQERRHLLNRIQAPHAAAIAAAEEIRPRQEDVAVTEMDRLRMKAEAMGKSIDDLKMPPGWGGMTY